MAAVAGSKGRISFCRGSQNSPGETPAFQADLVTKILSGVFDLDRGVEELISNAKLREVGIDTNMLCNLRCNYCYLDDRPREEGQLDSDQWLARLDPLARDGCKLFAFIGKEPLLDDTAIEVLAGLDHLRSSGLKFRTGMVTNGTRLDRYIDRLAEVNLNYLDISLDGLPQVNDQWRGQGTGDKVLRNLRMLLETNPKHDLFVACVLHQGNLDHITEFASTLFDMGLKGFFTSPILKFTRNTNIKEWSISENDLDRAIESLLHLAGKRDQSEQFQILVDLPYRYAWWLICNGRVQINEIFEDQYGVPYYQPDRNLPVYIKMNLFSYSFWRAIRITHDGTPISNLDLAAHPAYIKGEGQRNCNGTWSGWDHSLSRAFHKAFLDEHLTMAHGEQRLFDRDVAGQLARIPTMAQ